MFGCRTNRRTGEVGDKLIQRVGWNYDPVTVVAVATLVVGSRGGGGGCGGCGGVGGGDVTAGGVGGLLLLAAGCSHT